MERFSVSLSRSSRLTLSEGTVKKKTTKNKKKNSHIQPYLIVLQTERSKFILNDFFFCLLNKRDFNKS